MSIGLESSEICPIHVRVELILESAGTVAGSNADVVRAAADHDELHRLPDLIVTSAGSKR